MERAWHRRQRRGQGRLLNRDHTNISTGDIPDRPDNVLRSPRRQEQDVGLSPRRDRGKDSPIAPEPKTILVVEDDVDAVAVLRFALEREGFVVESADDGLNALQKARKATPDLVILDLNMPRMGGEQFLYAWRSGGGSSGVPVIVVTATSQALRPTDLGVEACIPKPLDIQQLLWHVRDLLVLPHRVPLARGRDPRSAEIADVAEDLASAISTVLISVEQLAEDEHLPDDLRTIASDGLDAAQRAGVLTRRLIHLFSALR